jgi:alpha-N-arabinofuranosidase
MKPLTRRQFSRFAGAGALAIIATRKGLPAVTGQSAVIHLDSDAGLIRPELHGQFAEHLGTCIYGGLWVGKGSPIPNVDGYRKQAVDYLRALSIPVLRWPGGCFADDYHWRDGIGPAAKRPKTVNLHWGNYTEDNSFGTHEFVGLCRAIGAEPYLAGNVGSGTPQELRSWVEYCNYPQGSTLSDERAANGSPEPFGVKYWGVGNENWGCGGRMTPQEYAGYFRRFATFIPNFNNPKPFLIACGPSKNSAEWTQGFLESAKQRPPDGFAMHFYSNSRDNATKFNAADTERQLSSFAELEQAILDQRRLMDAYDPNRKIGLMVDEWGVWDRIDPEEEKRNGRLWQQITMRSAVAAALGLNVFHRHADKLVMCNLAQIVNVLHSLLLTEGEHCVRTSTYYTYEMMKAHRGTRELKLETTAKSPLDVSISASREGGKLIVTLVNPRAEAAARVNITLAGGTARSAVARILHDPDWNACNTSENPDRLTPRSFTLNVQGGQIEAELPPLSIVTGEIALG